MGGLFAGQFGFARKWSRKNSGIKKKRRHPASIPATSPGSPAFIVLLFAFFLLSICFYHSSAWSASVTLAWDPSPDHSVAGYKIHYGAESGKYTHTLRVKGRLAAKAVIENLDEGKAYFFVITSVNARGKESAFSPEINSGPAQTVKEPAQKSRTKIPPSRNVAKSPDGKIRTQK